MTNERVKVVSRGALQEMQKPPAISIEAGLNHLSMKFSKRPQQEKLTQSLAKARRNQFVRPTS
jgi:hypothetical protein